MTEKKLTIREGGFYRTRDGRNVGPMTRGSGNDPTNFWVAPHGCISGARPAWCEDGSFWPKGHEHFCAEMAVHDLVSEWTDAEPMYTGLHGKAAERIAADIEKNATVKTWPWRKMVVSGPTLPAEGTLRDLDVKPGDVVEFVRGFDGMYKIHIGKRMVGRKIGGVEFEGDNGFRADCCHTFRLVSRAPATDTDAAMIQRVMEASLRDKEDAIMHDMGRPPAVDLNRLSVPFGLLDEVYGAGTQAALKAHDGPVEVFSAHGWHVVDKPEWYSTATYRAAPQPKVETHTREAWLWNFNVTKWKPASSATPVTITYTTTNGAIDPASYRVEARP